MTWDERVRTSDGVGYEQVYELNRGETTVFHSAEDCFDVTLRQGNGVVLCWDSRVRAAGQELQLGCTRAVRANHILLVIKRIKSVSLQINAHIPNAPAN